MINTLRYSGIILIILGIISAFIASGVVVLIPFWIRLLMIAITFVTSIILFALADIVERQEILYKEIREQNSLLYKLQRK